MDRRHSQYTIALALIAAGGAFLAWNSRGYRLDDALISYRYARNLAEGNGWVYNPGELFNGATSPLFTALTALSGRLMGDYELAAHLISSISMILGGMLAFLLLAASGCFWGGLAAGLLLVTNPLMIQTLGLETQLFLALSAAAVFFAAREKTTTAVIFAALASLARPDGTLLLAAVYGYGVFRSRKILIRPVLVALLLALPWLIFSFATFGSPVSTTLSAKMAQGESGLWGGSFPFLRYSWLTLTGFPYRGFYQVLPFVIAPFALPAVPIGPMLLAGAAFLQVMGYGLLGVPQYHWYYAPALQAAILLTGVAVGRLAVRFPRWLSSLLFLILAGSVMVQFFASLDVKGEQHPNYARLGHWLKANAGQEKTLAAFEVGTIGWHSGLRIVDPLGLVTPGAGEHIARKELAWWLERFHPDYIVLHHPIWPDFEKPVADHPFFQAHYEEDPGFKAQQVPGLTLYRQIPRR